MDSQLVTKEEFESDIHSSTPFVNDVFFFFHKILYVFPFVSNQLSNWAGLLGLFNWVLVCGLEWDQKGINKTLALMGFKLFCQLLTSPKLPLIIFNTTI